MRRFLPPRPFGPTLLLRATVLWVFLHGAMTAGSVGMEVPFPRALLGTPLTTLWMTAAIIAAVWFEMWRHGELTFLANLGYSFDRLAAIVLVACLLLEVGFRVSFG